MSYENRKTMVIFLSLFFLLTSCQPNEDVTLQTGKEKAWFDKPMRIAALQCNFGEDDLAVIDKWVDMNFNVEQLFHPIADNYSAIYDPNTDKKLLAAYVKKAHQKGLKIILYLNVHILGPSLEHNKNIWSQRNQDGSISYMYETYPSICLNSPWKEYFYTVLDSLKSLDIDGIFLDGPVITNGGCYCKFCKEKFRKEYHKNLTEHSKNRWKFFADTRDEFLQNAYDIWKNNNPNKVFYMNFPVIHARESFVRISNALKYNDILGTEGGFMFYGPAKDAFLWRPSLTSKLLEAIAPEKPRVIFMAADHKPWNWWLHSPLETKLCISSVIANAANIWYGLHGSTVLLNSKSGDAVKEVLGFYKDNEDLLVDTKSFSNVALFYSVANKTKIKSDFANPIDEKSFYGAAENALRGYYSLLNESHIPFDIITDLNLTKEKLNKYKIVILPNILAFNKNTEKIIRNFVKNGGLLIAELGASLFNKVGEKEEDFYLSDVYGVSTSGKYSKHKNYNYFIIDSNIKLNENIDGTYLPLPLISIDITPYDNTEVICKAIEDLSGRYVPLPENKYPFATLHKFGSGKAIYFAGSIGEMYNEYHVKEYRALLQNIILSELGETIEFENAPTDLEVVLRKQNQNLILHLVNYQAGPTRPFEKVTTISNLKFKIPKKWNITKVISKKLNTELKSYETDSSFNYVLPKMKDYELLLLVKGE